MATIEMNNTMFSNLKQPRDITRYTLTRGVTDFTQLEQFNYYEKGFPYLIVVSVPRFLEKMAENDSFGRLFKNYLHILEYEFQGMDNLDAMNAETSSISNGIQDVNIITSVTAQAASTFSFTYKERSGSPITKVHEVYLRGVRDPNSRFKHYNNLITVDGAGGTIAANEVGYEFETFSFLYMHTDNTGLLLEKAVYITGAMPTSADLTIYNATRGDIQIPEVSVEFTGFPIYGEEVEKRAKAILNHINTSAGRYSVMRNSYDYKYSRVAPVSQLGETNNTGLQNDALVTDTTGSIWNF